MSRDHSELEARLSAAYEARVQLVTRESLSPVPPAAETSIPLQRHENNRKRNPWVAPLLAAAAVLVVVAGVVVVSVSNRHHHSHTPPIAPRTLHTSNVVLQRGQEQTLADIPWNQVGPGWTLATWATSTKDGAPQTLYLVNPSGGRYKLVSPAKAVDYSDIWSPDGQRYLSGLNEFDLTTGVYRHIAIPKNSSIVSYTPTGYGFFGYKNKLDKLGNATPIALERFAPDGSVETTYPITLPPQGYGPRAPLATTDGKWVAVADKRGIAVFHGNGKLARTVTLGSPEWCTLASWWDKTTVVASCYGPTASSAGLWLVPLTGGAPSLLARVKPGDERDFSYDDAWRDSAGLVGLAQSGCGPDHFVRFNSAGMTTIEYPDRSVTKYGHSASIFAGHDGDYLTVLNPVGCAPQPTALLRTSSVTLHSVVLLGPGVNGGDVTGVKVFGADREP